MSQLDATNTATPRADGFAMPAEWEPHQLTLMAWPCRPETYRWLDGRPTDAFRQARVEQAAVANAVSDFEPVTMLLRPEHAREARAMLSRRIDLLEVELDDSWMRDNGPIFVRDGAGEVAIVDFEFNAWGERSPDHAADGRVPAVLASHLGVRRYPAPFVLEGGSFLVDGAGTLLTTEQCLLHENRNPAMSREQIEDGLRDYLGAETVVWLGEGHYDDFSTDGHIDDIAHFLAPGRVFLHQPSNSEHPDHRKGLENRRRLESRPDAHGRSIEVVAFDTGAPAGIPYLNLYVCNGGLVAPLAGTDDDDPAIEQLRAAYPDRELALVPASAMFLSGGGGPHCITQQVPAGPFAD